MTSFVISRVGKSVIISANADEQQMEAESDQALRDQGSLGEDSDQTGRDPMPSPRIFLIGWDLHYGKRPDQHQLNTNT